MFMRILVFNKVGHLMEVKADSQGGLSLANINLEEKSNLLDKLAKSERNYKTQAVVLPGG